MISKVVLGVLVYLTIRALSRNQYNDQELFKGCNKDIRYIFLINPAYANKITHSEINTFEKIVEDSTRRNVYIN